MKQKKSLAVTVILMYSILIILPICCVALYFGSVVTARLGETVRETANFYLSQVSDKTSSTLNAMRSSIYYLMSDNDTQEIMNSDTSPNQLKRLEIEQGLGRVLLTNNSLDSKAVTGIYLIKNENHYLSVLRGGEFLGTSSRIMQVYKTCRNANSARDLIKVSEYPGYSYCIVDYIDIDTLLPLGKIIFEIKSSSLVDSSYIKTIYKQSSVIVSRSNGDILSKDPAFSPNSLGSILINAKNEQYLNINNTSYYHVGQLLKPSRVRIDVFIPRSEILLSIHQAIFLYILFTVLVLLLTLLISGFLFYKLSKPVKQMMNHIDVLSTGDLQVHMETTPYRETERMVTAFNRMTDRLQALFTEVYNKGLLLREAEFNSLEAQIQPHFIFNVLELINLRCMAVNETGICKIISNLAQLLRSNITNKHKQIITFQEELQYVQYYLELQKERFGDKLNYKIDLEDPSILEYFLPKLTIQPLVENSIVHGLEQKREGGQVIISIWEEETCLCVRISDDGIGFDPTQIDINNNSQSCTDLHNHIALSNINRRIQLLYGSEYGMTISSEPGKGTKIMLTLPIDRDNLSERSFYDVQNYDRG